MKIFPAFLCVSLTFLVKTLYAQNPTLQIPQSSLVQTGPFPGEQNEIKIMEQMIMTTTVQLQTQKILREWMIQFNQHKEDFIQGNQTKAHTSLLVRTARQIHESISSSHLQHLFAKDYLDELSFFSSIAGKNGITAPK